MGLFTYDCWGLEGERIQGQNPVRMRRLYFLYNVYLILILGEKERRKACSPENAMSQQRHNRKHRHGGNRAHNSLKFFLGRTADPVLGGAFPCVAGHLCLLEKGRGAARVSMGK